MTVEWYEQAFGKLKDMMEVTFTLSHVSLTQSIIRTKVASATFEYFMNEELKETYTPQYKDHFTDVVTLKKIVDKDDKDNKKDDQNFVGKIIVPFGRIASVEFRENEKIMRDDPEQGVKTVVSIYPKVKSEAERRKDKEHYENELHNREQHMKNEHMRVQEEKRRQEEEKERYKAAMGKIMDKLCAVWKKIDHSFITTEEDEGDCLSLFSIHYEELFPVYQAYARQVPQFCKNPENYYILLQHFFHFLKEYGFACKNMEEYYTLLASLSPLVDSRPSDTLNLYYGVNFAGFVELILRIAFLKTQQDLGGPMGMEEFKEGEELPKGVSKLCAQPVEIATKLEELLDEFAVSLGENLEKFKKKDMLSEDTSKIFSVYFNTLGAMYKENAIPVDQTELELKKETFINLLKNLGFLDKEPFNEEHVIDVIEKSFKIPHENINFVEMLELIYKVAQMYPFSSEGMSSAKEVKKLMLVLDKLQDKKVADPEKFKGEIDEARKGKSCGITYLVPEEEQNEFQDMDERINERDEEFEDENNEA